MTDPDSLSLSLPLLPSLCLLLATAHPAGLCLASTTFSAPPAPPLKLASCIWYSSVRMRALRPASVM